MFYNNPKANIGGKTSFKKCPCLINKQYQYKTLGEMVAMYKKTGEFPAVGMRNGVYMAKSIDDEVPTTGDKFQDIQRAGAALEKSAAVAADTEAKISKAKKDADAAQRKELEDLRKKVAQASPVPSSSE